MSEKRSLGDWRGGGADFSPNSEYDSLGEVTLTVPVEVAAFWLGVNGVLPSAPTLPDGRRLPLYYGFYIQLDGSVSDAPGDGIPEEVLDQLDEIRNYGRQVGREGRVAARTD